MPVELRDLVDAPRAVVFPRSGSRNVEETTYLGTMLNLSANSPSRPGQAPGKAA